MKRISMAVAICTHGNVIGKGNALPWGKISADLRHFRKLTLGRAVIMGRRSHEDILAINGAPLADRLSIVLTRNLDYRAPGCVVAHDAETALRIAESVHTWHKHEEIVIAGGAEVYRDFFPRCDRLHVTYVDYPFEGDVCFPDISPLVWHETKHSARFTHIDSSGLQYECWFATLDRRYP